MIQRSLFGAAGVSERVLRGHGGRGGRGAKVSRFFFSLSHRQFPSPCGLSRGIQATARRSARLGFSEVEPRQLRPPGLCPNPWRERPRGLAE